MLANHSIIAQIHQLLVAIDACGDGPAVAHASNLAEALFAPTMRLLESGGSDIPAAVDNAHIDALMRRVVYTYEDRPMGSTATFCHAFLDGQFYLATGKSGCLSDKTYAAEVGRDLSTNNAMRAAREKLWELEGYRKFKGIGLPASAFATRN